MIDGYVLCGGQSKRMGTDKALLSFGDQAMADHMADILRQGGCRNVYLIRKKGMPASFKTPIIIDTFTDFHPLYGIVTALSHGVTEQVLISPCDLPWLSPSTIQKLVDSKRPTIIKNQPLLGTFPISWREKTQRFAHQGRSAFAHSLGCDVIESNPNEQKNVNYVTDFGDLYDHD